MLSFGQHSTKELRIGVKALNEPAQTSSFENRGHCRKLMLSGKLGKLGVRIGEGRLNENCWRSSWTRPFVLNKWPTKKRVLSSKLSCWQRQKLIENLPPLMRCKEICLTCHNQTETLPNFRANFLNASLISLSAEDRLKLRVS